MLADETHRREPDRTAGPYNTWGEAMFFHVF
jgi:hypothetical protein